MPTYKFTNGRYYPTVGYDSALSLTNDHSTEAAISLNGTEIHRGVGTILDPATGMLAYDLDAVDQLEALDYELVFEVYDSTDTLVDTVPSTPITLSVQTGSRNHKQVPNGRVEEPPDKVFGHISAGSAQISDADVTALDAQRQNDNEVNLTTLVNDGLYADIGDAIANEPPTNPAGTRHVIEPGTYKFGTSYTIDYTNREVVGYGTSGLYNQRDQPVELLWTGDNTTPMFDTARSQSIIGNQFQGIKFAPETAGNGHAALIYRAEDGANTSGFRWINCAIDQFGGPGIGIDDAGTNNVFGHRYHYSLIRNNSATASLGRQVRSYGADFRGTADPVVKFGPKSHVQAFELRQDETGLAGMEVAHTSWICPANAESSKTGAVGVRVIGNTGPDWATVITGNWAGWGTVVEVANGTIFAGGFGRPNTGSEVFHFTGGPNDHNGTTIIGPYAPSDITVDDGNSLGNRTGTILSTYHVTTGGASPSLPPTMCVLDEDGDGAGTPRWLYRKPSNGSTYELLFNATTV